MLISKPQLRAINVKTLKYPLDSAEKDYFLAVALSLIAQSHLKDALVFKGGTALHHCYLPQHRFSEDLDFTALRHDITAEEVVAVLQTNNIFEVKKTYTSPATIKIERLRYSGVLEQAGSIKVEIDHVQNVVLPAQEMEYRNVWNIPVTLQVMDIREVCAEKIRAASQRTRYRDFYDLYLIFDTFGLDLAEVLTLLRQKEVRRPITSEAIAANWQRAQHEFRQGVDLTLYAQPVEDARIQAMVDRLGFAPILSIERSSL